MINLIGFSPDLGPDTQGGLPVCMNIIPSDRGFKARPSAVDVGQDALAAACKGIISVRKTDGTIRTVAGTDSNLYDLTSPSWTSRLSGKNLGDQDRWRFAQFGNITLAVTPTEKIHYSESGNFTAITPTVKAEHIVSVSGFLLAANYNDGTDDIPDGWICSGYQDHTDWTPAASTQCAYGRLLGTAGPITAAKRLGSNAVLYQEKAIHFGVYVGAPAVWSFQEVYGDIGCLSDGLIVENEQFHYFFGPDDVYRFDGSNLTPLQAPCSRWVIDRMNKDELHLCQTAWDQDRGLAWWFYPSAGATTSDSYVCFHPETGRWGYGLIDIEAVVQYISGGLTYGSAPTSWTYATAPTYSYGSSYWNSETQNLSIVTTSHTISGLNGPGEDSSFTLSVMGSDQEYSLLTRLWMRFFTYPDTGSLTIRARYDADGNYELVGTADIDNGRFDFLSTALWHKLELSFTGDYETPGFDVTALSDGEP